MTSKQEELEGYWKRNDTLVHVRVDDNQAMVTYESGETETMGLALLKQAVGREHFERLPEGWVSLKATGVNTDEAIEYEGPPIEEL